MDEQALTELLECSVCLEQLDHSSKVLPCQHTFCRRCLDEIMSTKHELRCPECRFLVEMRVDELPANILLVRLLEGIKTRSGALSRSRNSQASSKTDNSAQASAFARQQQQKQGNGGSRPCAKALFSYEGKDQGDLSFKKGDLVYLRKQVDENWFHGEMSGQHGFFPASYVQVVTPIPSTIPQCKGLYDFEMEENKEGDCLSFKKNETVTVIRKVDENWLEGKKGDKIGIFPISFVEMNDPAKLLLNMTGSNSNRNTSVPVTPDMPKSSGEGPPAVPSPVAHAMPAGFPWQQKRHSFTSTSQQLPSPSSLLQRRSLELSSDTDLMAAGGTAAPARGPSSQVKASSPAPVSVAPVSVAPAAPLVPASVAVTSLETTPTFTTASPKVTEKAVKVATRSGNGGTGDLPTVGSSETSTVTSAIASPVYLALYNYKAQKEDEVGLKKGDYYSVAEKCQDGWFKGTCLATGKSGVFPGNYVQLVRSSSAFKPVRKSGNSKSKASGTGHSTGHMLPATASSPSLNTCVPVPPRPKTSPGRASSADRDIAPPVEPRSAISSSSPLHGGGAVPASAVLVTKTPSPSLSRNSSKSSSPNLTSSSRSSSSRGSKSISPGVAMVTKLDSRTPSPLTHSHSSSDKAPPSVTVGGAAVPKSGSSASPVWKHSMSACANITPPNVVVGATGKTVAMQAPTGATSSSSSSPAGSKDRDKKDKKEREKISLMKRLTTGKSKKSRNSSTDTDPASLSDSSISHTRSGSFPNEALVHSEGQHKKTGSFDSSTPALPKPTRPKPLAREKFRCVESYPPQSEIELDLKIGDIIYVHKKREDGWFKGTLQRSGKTGLFPGSFVEQCD